MKAAIFDLDGTLADHSHRRNRTLEGSILPPENWTKFFLGIPNDSLDPVIADLFFKYRESHHILICTGRPEWTRVMTTTWLQRHSLIGYHKLYMRPDNDMSQDCDLKRKMLYRIRDEGFNVHIAFEDRNQVVDMWRKEGITCLQVNEGDF